jgi:transposase
VDVIVARAIVDGAYGSGENRAACAERANPVDLLTPLSQPADAEVHKSAFQVDTQAQTATCPNGQTVPASTVTTHQEGRTAYTFTFERSLCETCPLFTRCVRSKTAGRTIQLGFYENYFQAARQRQETEEFKELYRLRPRIEGKQSELVAHGLRNTRYVGKAKRRLQRLWLAAAINLKRLGKLLEYPNGHTTRPQQAQALWMPAQEVKNALLTA